MNIHRLPKLPDFMEQLPWPTGPVSSSPERYEQVAPVVVAFVRLYLESPAAPAGWYVRGAQASSKGAAVYLHGAHCSAGGTGPLQAVWRDLVAAPVLGYDEQREDLGAPVPCDAAAFSPLDPRSRLFPSNLRTAIGLVLEHDLQALRQLAKQLGEQWQALVASGAKAPAHALSARVMAVGDWTQWTAHRWETWPRAPVAAPRAPDPLIRRD